MKLQYLPYTLFFFLALYSCSGPIVTTTEALYGLWKYDAAATLSRLDTLDLKEYNSQYAATIIKGLSRGNLHLNRKGRLTFDLGGTEQQGKWRVRKQGRQLVLNLTGEEQAYTIQFQGPDTLLLGPVTFDSTAFPRVLVRNPESRDE